MRILVTGASSGIGLRISNGLARSNYLVHGIGRRARTELFDLDKRVDYQSVDISDNKALDIYLKDVSLKSQLNAIVLNAGIVGSYNHFKDIEMRDIKTIFETNFFPNIQILSRLESLLSAGGSVVVISSNTLKYGGSSHNLPYSTSKAALEMATLSVAKTYAGSPHYFRINIIRPGVISTDLVTKVADYSFEDLSRRIGLIPKGKSGTVDDIFNLVNFLIDPKSEFIVGQTIAVAGGE